MKRILAILTMIVAFAGTALAWDPVIKETHWFGMYEYEGYNYGFGNNELGIPGQTMNWVDNYLESIIVVKTATGQTPQQQPKTSFYSWLDHQLRFKVDNTGNWELNHNGNGNYDGFGLYNKSGDYTCFWICNLKAGDKFNIEYYRENNNYSPFLAEQEGALSSVKDEEMGTYVIAASSFSGSAAIYGARGELVYYEVEEDGDVAINIPSHTVIRSVSIILNDEQYQKAEASVEPLQSADLQKYLGNQYNTSSFGYRYYYTKPGVLENKQGAVPYITMQFGADNDMTFVRKLSEAGQVTTYNEYWEEIPATVYSKDRGETDPGTPTVRNWGDLPYYAVDNNPNNGNNYGGAEWESQFWIGNTQLSSLPAGTQVKVSFWRYASQSTQTVAAQAHGPNAGDYISVPNLFSIEFGGWAPFEQIITVSDAMANADWNYIAFNLNPNNAANEYGFAEVKLEVLRREAVTTQSEGDFGAASIIDANNDFNPEHHQYHIYNKVFLDPSDTSGGVDIHPSGQRTEQDVRRMFIGKEWSVFKSQHAPESIPYSPNASYNGQVVVWRDIFDTIFPLCGNFFYFFPEVDGKLVVEYYCEGAEENPAFWWKTDAEGNPQGAGSQGDVHCKQYDLNGNQIGESVGRTNGSNNYYLTADLKRGCVYYLCSLPTNNAHEHPIIRVKSYSFIPKFAVSPLALVVNNTDDIEDGGTKNKIVHAAEIFGGPYQNLNVNGTFKRNGETLDKVRYFGNVKSATVGISTEGNRQFLNFSNIQFKEGSNPGGAIVVHLSDACGEANFVLTVAYDAVEAKWDLENGKRVQESGTEEVKHWDFYSNTNWDLGKYSNTSSKLYKEIHKTEEKTPDWINTYVNLPEEKEPIFKSVYDMEADNVDMIHETEGLVIHAHTNTVGLYNENDAPTAKFQDRYIGFMPGSKLVIPRLKENDRVVIKMGAYGNADASITTKEPITLTLNNAKDAMGTLISDDYIIGGSAEDTDATTKDATLPHGEYHFIVDKTSDSDDDDFSIEVKDGELLKIYSVVIYRNAVEDGEEIDFEDQVILTENQVMGDLQKNKRYILNTQEYSTNDNAVLHLNYRGLDEPVNYESHVRKTGNLTEEIIVSSSDHDEETNDYWYTYIVPKGYFGVFKTRLGVNTCDKTYVTDYADCMIPVGYRQLMEYPYTWDFTDLRAKYISDGIDGDGVEKDVDEDDLKIWDGYQFRGAPETYDGYIFSPGGQLYGGTKMFDETRGIGIVHSGENKAMSLTNPGAQGDNKGDGGLAVIDGQTLEFVVPQVPANGAVYVHARKVANAENAKVQSRVKTKSATAYTAAADFTFVGTDSTTGDDVFAIQNTDKHEAYINVCVQGYEVNKIAVATDAKSVNKKGYASESRDHAIDASLLPYFTGKPMRTYTVTGFNKDALTVTLNDVSVTNNYVVTANTGVVIFNDDTKTPTDDDPVGDLATAFGPFDGGFHLFVPDMHDQTGKEASLTGNLMVAALEGCDPVPYTNGDEDPDKNTTNYVLSFKYKKLNGNNLSTTIEGPERFYRVYSGNPVKLKANSAYMQLPTAQVAPGGNVNAPTRISFRHINFMRGDVNSDRSVDVADFIGVANSILDQPQDRFNAAAADVNDDNNIDVADFIGVANIILTGSATGNVSSNAPRCAPALESEDNGTIMVEPFNAEPGTQQVLSVKLSNIHPATGFEFSLVLPEGITVATDGFGLLQAELSEARTTAHKTNFFSVAGMGDGMVKVLCGTTAGNEDGLYAFEGNDGEVARIVVNVASDYTPGEAEVSITNAKYAGTDGQSYRLGTMVTGIRSIDFAEAVDGEYYTVSGQRLEGRPTQRGVYILNGKKVLVK